jgi:hypothetical protein
MTPIFGRTYGQYVSKKGSFGPLGFAEKIGTQKADVYARMTKLAGNPWRKSKS